MRKIKTAATVIGLAALTAAIPFSPAQATSGADPGVQAANCDREYWAHVNDGYVRAYDYYDCSGLLGGTPGDDSNWSDTWGAFQSTDNDRATSLLNTGTYANGWDIVMFFRHAGYQGGHGCLTRGEKYVDDLRDNALSDGYGADDSISSHKWVNGGCSTFLT